MLLGSIYQMMAQNTIQKTFSEKNIELLQPE
jgi:hypothetical protein